MDETGTLIEDPILERLARELETEDGHESMLSFEVGAARAPAAPPGAPPAEAGMSPDEEAGAPPDSEAAPYDLEVEAPRALSLPRLLELTGKPVPPEIAATIGDYRAIILLHGLTPFHPRGARPREIWGLGYQATLVGCDAARTVAYEPGNQILKVAEVNQAVAVDLSVDGRLAAGVPGELPLPLTAGLGASACTKQGFVLSLHIEWAAVEVQAGPVGAGGVRWNIYRQGSRIDRHHRLIQTALVPASTKALTIEVTTWIRRRGGFFGLFGTREWCAPPRRFELPIETGSTSRA